MTTTTALDLNAQPGDLSWADVDPSQRLAPDEVRARELAVGALMDTERGDPKWRAFALAEISRRFAHAWGPWACGWSWACNSGGAVTSWCCTSHSLCPKRGDHDDVEETAGRATDALLQWHLWLVRLGALFRELDVVGRAEISRAALATAAARIVDVVVEQTHAEDAWYFHCGQVIGWFLEHQGVDARDTAALIETAIGGRFESWTGPAPQVRHEVADLIGAAAAGALGVLGAGGAPGLVPGGEGGVDE